MIRKVAMKKGIISTVAGDGTAGFSGDGGPGAQARLRQPHSIVFDRDGSLLICDLGNHRIRPLHLDRGSIETYAGTGDAKPTQDNAPVSGTPLNGPRTLAIAPNGDIYLTLREGNAIFRIDATTRTSHRIAGTSESGYSGEGGPALKAAFGRSMARLAGPNGLAYAPGDILYVADTESQAIRRINLKGGTITTVLGAGQLGDGSGTDPLAFQLNRPHAVWFGNGVLYAADSEAHRILVVQ